ncbi:hypothetical protein Y032_0147g2601 [Ancylostoma ceylanicum]|nr:hypothetical protein Y032_0147g2601 [Ancylostoma ceylanicum]
MTGAVLGGGMKKKSSSCPFGEGFYSKLTKLMLSKEPNAVKELRDCVKMVSAAKLTPNDEFWDSGDELAPIDAPSCSPASTSASDIRAIPSKKGIDRPRLIHLDMVPTAEKRTATKAKIDAPPVPEKKRKGPIVFPSARRSDDSDSDDAKAAEKVANFSAIRYHRKREPCKKCGEKSTTPANTMLTCEGCHATYHQKCHKPEVTVQQCTDPRFIFLCTDCSGKGVTSTKSRSSSPKLFAKAETSSQTRGTGLAPRSGSDISATFEAYKKKSESFWSNRFAHINVSKMKSRVFFTIAKLNEE